MNSPRPQDNDSGFTIIEIMIVLAIAAIILMLVLLAVPALTRSSRDNQRRQDVQSVLQTVSQYELNNSGTLPATGDLQPHLNNKILSYYTASSITVCTYSGAPSPAPCTASDNTTTYSNQSTSDTMIIYNHAKCAGGNFTNQGAGYSDVVATYTIETGGGTSPQCEQL